MCCVGRMRAWTHDSEVSAGERIKEVQLIVAVRHDTDETDLIYALDQPAQRSASTVVERRMPYHQNSRIKLAFTTPWLAWEHLRMLSLAERLSWGFWLAAAVLLGRVRRSPPYAFLTKRIRNSL